MKTHLDLYVRLELNAGAYPSGGDVTRERTFRKEVVEEVLYRLSNVAGFEDATAGVLNAPVIFAPNADGTFAISQPTRMREKGWVAFLLGTR